MTVGGIYNRLLVIQRERRIGDKVEQETVYYSSSLPTNSQQLLRAFRVHWSIENNLYWFLDMTFHEDELQVRQQNAQQNMAVLRHIDLNILKRHLPKGRLKQKRYRAALDDTFLPELLAQV